MNDNLRSIKHQMQILKKIIWSGEIEDRTVSVCGEISRWNATRAVASQSRRCPKVVQMPGFHWSIVPTTACAPRFCISRFFYKMTMLGLQKHCICSLSHLPQHLQCSAATHFNDTCLFVPKDLFVLLDAALTCGNADPRPRWIKAFIPRFVKSTNQCLFSPFVLICEWDIIPNFADMSHLCRIELGITGNPNISIAPRKKSRDARFASELEKCFVKNGGLGFTWSPRPSTCFHSECKFYKIAAQNESDTVGGWVQQKWAGHVFCSTWSGIILSAGFRFSLMTYTSAWSCWSMEWKSR